MPAERRTNDPSKVKPFKPPRPSVKPTTAQSGNSSSSSNRVQPSSTLDPRPSINAPSGPDADPSNEPGSEERQTSIPPALLTRLLHEFFSNDQVRISKAADRAIGKYMDTFVREAIARAAVERMEGRSAAGGVARGEEFLEVS
jgi:centromere protein X